MNLLELQTGAETRLSSLDYFKNLPVLCEQKHDLATEHQKAIDELGLSIVIVTPLVESIQADRPKVNAAVELIVQITENVPINQSAGSKKHAVDVAMEAARALHWQSVEGFTALLFQKLVLVLDDPLLVYQAHFRCQGVITPL